LDDRNAENHPFIEAMGYCMKQSFTRTTQAKVMKHLPLESNRRFDESLKLMHTTVDEVIQQRKNGPEAKDINKDLLGFMLNARDENNLGLTDENIRDQVITFLIAGHETTSNTLAWTLYELSRHPEIEEKILQEIVNLGITHDGLPTSEQSSSMKYTYQVLKETLRMYSPLRALGKYCKKGKQFFLKTAFRLPQSIFLISLRFSIQISLYPEDIKSKQAIMLLSN